MEIGFLTFADGNAQWKLTGRRIVRNANKGKVFSRIRQYTLEDISALLSKEELDLCRNSRGFGYWIWKPIILLDFATRNPNLDLIIYADAGCFFNISKPTPKARLLEYFDWAKKEGIVAFQSSHPEEMWTKSDLLREFKGNNLEGGQFLATVVIGTPTKLLSLCEEWLELARRDNHHFLDDSPSTLKNSENFREHRHDQSIFSCLAKRDKYLAIPESETYFEDWKNADNYPIWSTRLMGSAMPIHGKYIRKILNLSDRVYIKISKTIQHWR